MKSILSIVLFIFFLSACIKQKTCPPDQNLGNLNLSANSKDYLPYEGKRFIEFVDSAALDTAILFSETGLIHDFSKTIVKNICLEDENRSDSFYVSEHLTVDFFDLDTGRRFRIVGNVGINEDFLSKNSTPLDPVLYDELKLTVHRTNPSLSGSVATLEFVTNDRGNANRMSNTLKSRLDRYHLISEVIIHDSIYKDVYEFRYRDSATYYFKPNKGVVAFRDINSRWWNFHRTY